MGDPNGKEPRVVGVETLSHHPAEYSEETVLLEARLLLNIAQAGMTEIFK